ncbi:hypothetical protein MMC07_003656 [Pseudocyphellaria aurata]|nr:hypothetical protein [Pseudocyphellaria aurata]
MGVTTNEFPLLNAAGLYVKDTAGNGNCLFNALSDQLYGDQSKHGELRLGVIRHMRENAAFYKQFIEVHPGGGVRRNPKRKNAGSFSTPHNTAPPTADEINRVFENHLQHMARGGTYGDHLEVTAFSEAFNVDVKIYQRDHAYVISTKPEGAVVPVVHIAHHVWEHYSSIRNVDGPHTGPPKVKQSNGFAEAEKAEKKKLSSAPHVLPWKVNIVTKSLPYGTDRKEIIKTIEDCGGNVDAALSRLLDSDERSSASSARASSSVEREVDSDDEEPIRGPKKRQDRRLSRAARALAYEKEERCNQELSYRLKSDHLATTIERSTSKDDHRIDVQIDDADETEEEDWRNEFAYKDSESASASTSASDYSTASNPRSGGVRLKLSQPKRCETSSSNQGDYLDIPGKRSSGHDEIQQFHLGPVKHKRHLHSRHRRDLRKADQIIAMQERKKSTTTGRAVSGPSSTIPLMIKQDKENTPAIEAHIKVLYI